MYRLFGGALLLLVVAGASRLPVALVHASTVQGNAVQISGLDDLNATADNQARKGSGKTIAMILGMGGLAGILGGRVGLGLAGVGSGLAMGFVPGMVSSTFDAAPAATAALLQHGLATHWWTPAVAALYPPLLAVRLLQDPVFLVSLAVVCVVSTALSRARRRVNLA
jgi:hypothetical protein